MHWNPIKKSYIFYLKTVNFATFLFIYLFLPSIYVSDFFCNDPFNLWNCILFLLKMFPHNYFFLFVPFVSYHFLIGCSKKLLFDKENTILWFVVPFKIPNHLLQLQKTTIALSKLHSGRLSNYTNVATCRTLIYWFSLWFLELFMWRYCLGRKWFFSMWNRFFQEIFTFCWSRTSQ